MQTCVALHLNTAGLQVLVGRCANVLHRSLEQFPALVDGTNHLVECRVDAQGDPRLAVGRRPNEIG
jgi:hypothetical protein